MIRERSEGAEHRAVSAAFGVVLLLACALCACRDDEVSAPAPAAARTGPPNVLLIVVDTLRADHLSHYGYDRQTAAPLDGFRARSTVFSRAYSTAPWTGPATMSILTGLSPLQHRATEHGDVLPDAIETLAERLRAAGYRTHGISFNQEVTRATGYAQGFDVFDDYVGKVIDYPDIRQMVRRVEAWLEASPAEPFFLYLQPMNVHGPYRVPRSRQTALLGRAPDRAFEYYGRDLMAPLMRQGRVELRAAVSAEIVASAVDQYDVAVHYSMEEIARMLAAIEAAGRLENTLVVLTSDHGEELFDHGGFSHGFTLYREVLHVPLYLHRPGQETAQTVDRAVSILDIVPTILAQAGLVPTGPAAGEFEGVDLLSDPGPEAAPRLLVQQAGWTQRAKGLSLVRGRDHLVELEHAYDAPNGRIAFYDLAGDPAEREDRAAAERAEVRRLREALASEVDRLARASRLPDPENVLEKLGEEETARLRALGYVE